MSAAMDLAVPFASLPIGTALLGAGAVVVWNDVAPEGRTQFYDWHDKEHIPERLGIRGFRRGRRYVRRGHSPEWLTVYEAADLDVLTSPEYFARLNAPTPGTVDTLRHFRNTSRAVCELVCSVGTSTGGHMLAMRLTVPEARSRAMCSHLAAASFPRAMASTGVVACHLFAADQAASHVNTAESSTRAFDVPAWVLLAEATMSDAAESLQRRLVEDELPRFDVDVRRDAGVYQLEICRLGTATEPII